MDQLQFKGISSHDSNWKIVKLLNVLDHLAITSLVFEWADSYDNKVIFLLSNGFMVCRCKTNIA
jgi:hypothetical protein